MSKQKEPVCKIETLGITNTTLECRIELRPDIFRNYETKAKEKNTDVGSLMAEAITAIFNRLNEETVEVTAKIPKRVMRLLEDQDFFGYSKEDFVTMSVHRGIDCELSELDVDVAKNLEKKFGHDVNVWAFTVHKKLCKPNSS